MPLLFPLLQILAKILILDHHNHKVVTDPSGHHGPLIDEVTGREMGYPQYVTGQHSAADLAEKYPWHAPESGDGK